MNTRVSEFLDNISNDFKEQGGTTIDGYYFEETLELRSFLRRIGKEINYILSKGVTDMELIKNQLSEITGRFFFEIPTNDVIELHHKLVLEALAEDEAQKLIKSYSVQPFRFGENDNSFSGMVTIRRNDDTTLTLLVRANSMQVSCDEVL